jgi:hypothetical protein
MNMAKITHIQVTPVAAESIVDKSLNQDQGYSCLHSGRARKQSDNAVYAEIPKPLRIFS